MNEIDIIQRRIELKKQLIEITKAEIEELEKMAGDRLITENRQPEPASLA